MNGYLEQIEYLQSIELKDADGNVNSFSYFDYSNTPSEDIFHKFFEDYQSFLTRNINRFNYKTPYLVFINSTNINAFAWKPNNVSLIGINSGTVIELANLFHHINLESILSGNMGKYRIMEDERLEKFIDKLYFSCQMFIFFHEIGHIVQNIDGSSNFQNEMANQSHYSDIQHLKEYDADQFAAIHMASSVGHWMEKLDGEFKDKYYNKEIYEMLLSIACAGCFIPFLIFQKYTSDFYTRDWSHPHPSIRAGYILNTMVDALKKNNKGGFEIDQKVVLNDAFEITRRIVNDAVSRSVIFKSEDDYNKFYEIWVTYVKEIKEYFEYLNDMAQKAKGLACEYLAPKI